ncbi:MAG: ATP-dependent Clp protease proteolytic subunit [Caulobacteraceae bacterium]
MTIRLDDEDEDDKSDLRRSELPLVGGPIQDSLFKSRTVLLFGEIDMKMAERVMAQLLALAEKGDQPIRLIINSPGGHVESGDTIHDAIRFCGPKVKVIGTGWVASAGALIYLGARRRTASACPTPASCCTSRWAGCAGRPRTSPSRPRRSSRCASA